MQPLHFRPLSLEARGEITAYLAQQPYAISDITFGNLYIWKHARAISYTTHAGTLLIQTCYEGQTPYFFFPIGAGDSLAALRALESYAKQGGFPLHFASLESHQLPLLRQAFPDIDIEATPDRFDYVYSVEELLSLSGRKFHKKKNHLNSFLQRYLFHIEAIHPANTQELMQAARSWLDSNPNKTAALELEYEGICAALRDFHALGLRGILVRAREKEGGGDTRAQALDSRLESSQKSPQTPPLDSPALASALDSRLDSPAPVVAFSFGEEMDTDMAVIHIEKASPHIIGAYQIINQQLLKHCFATHRYVNREEDLGIPGLRQAKRGYNPIFMVEKFYAKARR